MGASLRVKVHEAPTRCAIGVSHAVTRTARREFKPIRHALFS